jgi:hypothetical protein
MLALSVPRKANRCMSYPDKKYQKKIAEVSMIMSESEFVAMLQTLVQFGNKWIMKSAVLQLTLEEPLN